MAVNEKANNTQHEPMPKAALFEKSGEGAVLCFGEVMLRLSPPADTSWLTRHHVQVNLAGAECNVASALATWGIPVKYCTALPDNNISASVLQFLRNKGIDVSAVNFSGARIGLYYIEHGTDLKQGGVLYDRKYSSFGELRPGMIDWDAVLQGVSWFHFTAINPALNENVTAVCIEALKAAKQKDITISVDLNYRAKLWQYGKKPVEVMPALAEYCDVIMGNLWAANTLLGIPLSDKLIAENTKECYLAHAEKTAVAVQQKFPSCKTVALTFRLENNSGELTYYGALHTGGRLYASQDFVSQKVVDKVGSGDCFMAGLIYGIINNRPAEDVIEYASAAAFGKLHETGDITNHSINDIQTIIQHHAYTF